MFVSPASNASSRASPPREGGGGAAAGRDVVGDVKVKLESIRQMVQNAPQTTAPAAALQAMPPPPPELGARPGTHHLVAPVPGTTKWRDIATELRARVDFAFAKRVHNCFMDRYHENARDARQASELITNAREAIKNATAKGAEASKSVVRAAELRGLVREQNKIIEEALESASTAVTDSRTIVEFACPAIVRAVNRGAAMDAEFEGIRQLMHAGIKAGTAPASLEDALELLGQSTEEIIARKVYLDRLVSQLEKSKNPGKGSVTREVEMSRMTTVLQTFELSDDETKFREPAEDMDFHSNPTDELAAHAEREAPGGAAAAAGSRASSITSRAAGSRASSVASSAAVLTPVRERVRNDVIANQVAMAQERLGRLIPLLPRVPVEDDDDNASTAPSTSGSGAARGAAPARGGRGGRGRGRGAARGTGHNTQVGGGGAPAALVAMANGRLTERPKPANVVAANLRADRNSATELRSSARLFGCDAAARIMAGMENGCPAGTCFPGEKFRLSYTNHLRPVTNGEFRFGEIPDAMARPMFEHPRAFEDTSSLYTGMMSGVTVSASTARSDAGIATEISKIFDRRSVFNTHAPEQIVPMLIPLVAASRIKLGSPEWLDLGRAFASTYARYARGALIARAAWAEMTAQKTLIARARAWVASENDDTFSPRTRRDTAALSDRMFAQWVFGTHNGGGIGLLRNAAAAATPTVHDDFDFLYSSTLSKEASPGIMYRALTNDPFAARNYPLIFALFAETCSLGEASGAAFGGMLEDYVAFREEYRTSMRAVHQSVVTAFIAGTVDIVGHARTYGTGIRVAAGANAIEATLQEAKAELKTKIATAVVALRDADARGDESPVQRAINDTARSTVERSAEAAAEVGGATRVQTFASPEDFEWNFAHENNCALMFMHMIRRDGLMQRQNTLRAERETRIGTKYPDVAQALATGLPTPISVGVLLAALAHVREPDDVIATIGMAIDTIRKNEIDAACAAAWQVIGAEKTGRITMRTVGDYSEYDSPTDFDAWQSKWALDALHAAAVDAAAREMNIGAFAARILWLTYICIPSASPSGVSSAHWYRFDPKSHYLRKLTGSGELTTDISEWVYKAFDTSKRVVANAANIIERKLQTMEGIGRADQGENALLQATTAAAKHIDTGLTMLERLFTSDRGRVTIVNAMRNTSLLTSVGMGEFVNDDPGLLAFENGIVDLKSTNPTEVIFRAGKIEDYITMTTKINMPYGGLIKHRARATQGEEAAAPSGEEFSDTHPDVVALGHYLAQVFPDVDERHYALVDFSSFLYGRNADRQFRTWIGKGANSKSLLAKIFQKMFGMYAFDLPVEAVATKQFRNSSSASPELAQGVGARIAFMSEPASGTELDAGIIKRLTGNERIFARGLHENGGSRDIMYKIIMLCNDPPSLSDFDEASKKRLVFLPFLSKWSLSAPTNPDDQERQHHYPMDTLFEKHVPMLARALAWKLFHVYPEYKQRGKLPPCPAVVTNFINNYWKDCDIYLGFQDDCIAQTPNGVQGMLKVQDAYAAFQRWWAERNPGGSKRQPSFQDFKMNMSRVDRLGAFQIERRGGMSGWTEWCLRVPDAEEEEEAPVAEETSDEE